LAITTSGSNFGSYLGSREELTVRRSSREELTVRRTHVNHDVMKMYNGNYVCHLVKKVSGLAVYISSLAR